MAESFDGIRQVVHREQQTPCVLIVDSSWSMTTDNRIDHLNRALKEFKQFLQESELVRHRSKILVIRCGGSAEKIGEWVDGADFNVPMLTPSGETPLGAAVRLGLSEIENLKRTFKAERRPYTRPVMVVMSDGAPTDSDEDWRQAVDDAQRAMAGKHVQIWPVAILTSSEGADVEKLAELKSPSEKIVPIYDESGFAQFFDFLGRALAVASTSSPGDAPEAVPYKEDNPVGPAKHLLF